MTALGTPGCAGTLGPSYPLCLCGKMRPAPPPPRTSPLTERGLSPKQVSVVSSHLGRRFAVSAPCRWPVRVRSGPTRPKSGAGVRGLGQRRQRPPGHTRAWDRGGFPGPALGWGRLGPPVLASIPRAPRSPMFSADRGCERKAGSGQAHCSQGPSRPRLPSRAPLLWPSVALAALQCPFPVAAPPSVLPGPQRRGSRETGPQGISGRVSVCWGPGGCWHFSLRPCRSCSGRPGLLPSYLARVWFLLCFGQSG